MQNNNWYDYSPEMFGKAKNRMCALKDKESQDLFFKVFASMVKDGSWVHAPLNGKQLVIIEFRGGNYIAIYSCLENRVSGDSTDLVAIDINKFIDILYDDPRLLGFVVDPNKDPFLINRKAIHDFTIRKDPRICKKDWGKGIPNYSDKDLMVKEELLDFGMQIVEDFFIRKNDFKVLEANYGTKTFPNFALEKDGEIFLVKVDCGVVDKPSLSQEQKSFYLSHSKKFNARCLYASMAIVSSDEERAIKKLALYGDGYNVIFDGVEELL